MKILLTGKNGQLGFELPRRNPCSLISSSIRRLDASLIRNTFDLKLPDWQHGVNHVLQQIL